MRVGVREMYERLERAIEELKEKERRALVSAGLLAKVK